MQYGITFVYDYKHIKTKIKIYNNKIDKFLW